MRRILGVAVALGVASAPLLATAPADAATGWKTGNNLSCVAGKGTYTRGGGKVKISTWVTDRCTGKGYAAIVFKVTDRRGKANYSGYYSPRAFRHGVVNQRFPAALTMPVKVKGQPFSGPVKHLYVKECLIGKFYYDKKAKKWVDVFRNCGPSGYKKLF
ncbi:hypothetical protein [Actinomadura macrotermitis]|uniref:Uncharacterized protein n=1 Tax=Actinomadura macrotermitis TaxID=2585200 RepID=A0A7K0C0P8_9ACTN|nr:hypothetical protein [Actinomadura macrotermitis]MQY07038.1 hypothetical protein [Actinomadura macrotermitis]